MKKIEAFVSILTLALGTSCSMKSGGSQSTISIPIPSSSAARYSQTAGVSRTTAGTNCTATNTLDCPPSTWSGFTCFGVEVWASDIPRNPAFSCSGTEDQAVHILGGLVPAGAGTIDLPVPSGPDRHIRLFGVQTAAGVGCPDIGQFLQTNSVNQNIGSPFLLAETDADIFQDTSVNMTVSYDPTNPIQMFPNCKNVSAATAGVPSMLAINPSMTTATAGSCAGFKVFVTDNSGTPTMAPTGTSVYFSTTGSLGVYAGTGCVTAATGAISMPTTGSMPMSYLGTVSGNTSITASASGLNSTTQGIAITSGPAAGIQFATGGTGTGIAGYTISPAPTFNIVDTYGNIAYTATGSAMFNAYTDSACTASAGTVSNSSVGLSSGVAAFSSLSIPNAGGYYFTGSYNGFLTPCTGFLTVHPSIVYSPNTITLTHGTTMATVSGIVGGGTPTACTASPTLPAGLTLSTTCAVSGNPTTAQAQAAYNISVTVNGYSSTTTLYITIN